MAWIQQIFGQTVPISHITTIFLGCYVLGCFATGYYLVRWRLKLDVRQLGSGNVGARNVGRVLGAPGFLVTVAFDFAKGALAVGATRLFNDDGRLAGLAMLAVVLGHIWPIQLGFHGGKGVATTLGALAAYDYQLLLAFGVMFVGLFFIFQRTTLSGLMAFVLVPLAAMFLEPDNVKAVVTSLVAGLILLAHRKNLMEEFHITDEDPEVETKSDHSIK
jgi:glycerol-3-phosphate acyltransferase PlsY